MVVKKPQKFSRSHPSISLDQANGAGKTRCKKVRRKSGLKKIFLKSAARNIVMPDKNSNGSKKKVVCIRKRCHIKKNFKKKPLPQTSQDLKDRVSSWLKNQDNLKLKSLEPVSTATTSVPPVIETKTTSKEEAEINALFQPVLPKESCLQHSIDNNSENDTVHNAIENVLKSSSVTAGSSCGGQPIFQTDNETMLTSSENSHPMAFKCDDSNNLGKKSLTPVKQKKSKVTCVSRGPLCSAKSLKASVASQRRAFQRFYLKNSHGGYYLALKKFKKANQCKAGNNLPTTISDYEIASKAPMKISVSQRRDPPPSCITSALTSDHDRSASQFLVSPKGLPPKGVLSCKLPFDSSVDSGMSEDERGSSGEEVNTRDSNNQVTEKRDVCYVFALLDREKSETAFKCSPHFKSSQILEQLGSLIQTISTDDDLMTFRHPINPTNNSTPKRCVERSTSPIFCVDDFEENSLRTSGGCGTEPTNDWEVPPSVAESSPENHVSSKLCTEELEKAYVTPAVKVMVVKSLMGLTSELNVPIDVSVRLLKWTSTVLKGDIDTNTCQDTFEGYLCLCHDKVSILLESCYTLDSKFILNLGEKELKNMWLLHDALCCMLQAYRYIQDLSYSASSHLRQHLLSLMTTCAKTILPNDKVTVPMWISFMTMIQGINEKLCQKDVLSKACQCKQHFISLSKNRFCRMCDLNCLYKDLCSDSEKNDNLTTNKEKSEVVTSSATVVEQLFPRYSWFLSRIENMSEEEFKTVYAKHMVMKFACNPQSGLLPCNEHLREITCLCFSSSLGFDSQAVVDAAASAVLRTENEEEIESSLSHVSGSDHPSVLEVGTCTTSQSSDKNAIPSFDGPSGKDIPNSDIGLAVGMEINNSDLDSGSIDGTVCLNGEGSTQSSEDFTLQLQASPSETSVVSTSLKKNIISNNTTLSGVNGILCAENERLESDNVNDHDMKLDETLANGLSKSPDISHSPLNFQLAQTSLESALSSFESHSSIKGRSNDKSLKSNDLSQALADRCNQYFKSKSQVPVEEITLDSEYSSDISECMRDVSLGEDSVFESSPSQDQGSGSSQLANKGSFIDFSSVESENKFLVKSWPSSKVCGNVLTDESTSDSLQTSSDSLQVLSQNKETDSNCEVSSNSFGITMPSKWKHEMQVKQQKKFISPPLNDMDQSTDTESSNNSNCSYNLNDTAKSVKNRVAESTPLFEGKDHRTRSGKDFKANQQLPRSSEKICAHQISSCVRNTTPVHPEVTSSNDVNAEEKKPGRDIPTKKKELTQSKEVDKIEQLKDNKHNVQARKSALKGKSKNHDVASLNCSDKQENIKEDEAILQETEQVEICTNQSPSSFTADSNSVTDQQDLNDHDDDDDDAIKEVKDLLERVGKSKRNDPLRKKLLLLAKEIEVEDSGPDPSTYNIRSRKSASRSTTEQSPEKINKVITAEPKEQSLEVKDEIMKDRFSESASKSVYHNTKCNKINDAENETERTLTSILKMGTATQNVPECRPKRRFPKTEHEFSATGTKKVRFSSPDNSYHFIERTKDFINSQKVSGLKTVDESSLTAKNNVSMVGADKTSGEPNTPVTSHQTKPVRKRQSQRINKSNNELVSIEENVDLKANSGKEDVTKNNVSDAYAANSEPDVFSSQTIMKNISTPEKSKVSEIPAKTKKSRGKKCESKQTAISIPDEHMEKSSKRKQTKSRLNLKKDEKALDVCQSRQKILKSKKDKIILSTETTAEDEPVDYDNSWNKYLSKVNDRLK